MEECFADGFACGVELLGLDVDHAFPSNEDFACPEKGAETADPFFDDAECGMHGVRDLDSFEDRTNFNYSVEFVALYY